MNHTQINLGRPHAQESAPVTSKQQRAQPLCPAVEKLRHLPEVGQGQVDFGSATIDGARRAASLGVVPGPATPASTAPEAALWMAFLMRG